RIAGQQVRLAAAAAEVLGALGAGDARLLYPALAAEAVEGLRLVPDLAHAARSDVRQIESGEHARGVTRQRRAVGGDGEEYRPEAAHARLGARLEIVRHH